MTPGAGVRAGVRAGVPEGKLWGMVVRRKLSGSNQSEFLNLIDWTLRNI
jgi:hypothetical protein